MIKKVGITGGIGVGKTFCCTIFDLLGIPIYNADIRAKHLMVHDEDVKAQIIDHFGSESYAKDGQLNKKHLADIIFSYPEKTKRINQIVHPAVGMDLVKWFNFVEAPYGLYEAALMYESGSVSFLDFVIVVNAPLPLRIKRTIQRDGISEAEIIQRINKQMPQEEKVKRADYVIQNDGNHSVIHQVWEVHQRIISLKKSKV
ncbi:MAG: dephospho-CoA kinase [Saprospiraceae bacterium]